MKLSVLVFSFDNIVSAPGDYWTTKDATHVMTLQYLLNMKLPYEFSYFYGFDIHMQHHLSFVWNTKLYI